MGEPRLDGISEAKIMKFTPHGKGLISAKMKIPFLTFWVRIIDAGFLHKTLSKWGGLLA